MRPMTLLMTFLWFFSTLFAYIQTNKLLINKSQGKTLKEGAIYMPRGVFSHGQLYTALSTFTNPKKWRIFLGEAKTIPNIVWTRVLSTNTKCKKTSNIQKPTQMLLIKKMTICKRQKQKIKTSPKISFLQPPPKSQKTSKKNQSKQNNPVTNNIH